MAMAARAPAALVGVTALLAMAAPANGARVLQQAGNGNALVANTPGAAYSYQAVVPVSYFNNYVGTGVANAPYTISFSTGQVFNGGTAYYIGNMATPTEQFNTFTIPVTGGAGPCPNGAMRSGTLSVTCGASSTSFNVVENPMCTYAMTYVTTQACPSPVPASYFNNYVGQNVANAPYTLSFSTGMVYNGGTAYYIGNMAWPSEVGNTFTIPVTGGAGPCPNGAMRSGTLQVTCGASSTSFNVVENPMCNYAMTYVTTQACPSPVPVSYFSNYQGLGVANAPYTLSFSTAQVYNGGTAYYIGSMAWPSEVGNTFTIAVTGGAGPCPNGAMRSGVLTLTCSAATTTFNVVENPMCTYAMTYSTTQPCPDNIAPALAPSVQSGGWSYQGCFNDASARTLPVLLSSNANVQQCQALGRSGGYNVVGAEWQGECWACNGCNYQSAGQTNTCSTSGPFAAWASTGMPSGAGWALAVYTTASTPVPSPSPPSPSPPPPTVYSTGDVVDHAASTNFAGRVIGTGTNNPHVQNGGATSSSTETTANGDVNVWLSTTTTETDQEGTGNGHITSQVTSTDTTATGHPVTHVTHNTHTSTSDLTPSTTEQAGPAAPTEAICDGGSFAIQDQAKNLCLHVKGGVAQDGTFTLSTTATRLVVTMQCIPKNVNQLFRWLPGSTTGTLRHEASGLLLAVVEVNGALRDGSAVTVLPPNNGDLTQSWIWSDPTSGGTLSSAANPDFELTDSKVSPGANVGLPVHMWHLHASLPTGSPNAAWMAGCAN